ncbi:unnamed protein product [Rotaria socialis]|uniref:DDE Tnp4 domain-containing protein n=2 Tax=Rotaria socialis TaxID=392032 RepID=A0A820T448_9BILA|nr:unnamed protein product [Rotaria socialis]CAF4464936.1 unnamed protein product [Rotaria socialis]
MEMNPVNERTASNQVVRTIEKEELITLHMNCAIASHKICCVCQSDIEESSRIISSEDRDLVFLKKNILIPEEARCCPDHMIDDRLALAAINILSPFTIQYKQFSSGDVQLLLSIPQQLFQKQKRLYFDDPLLLSDDEYRALITLSKDQFNDLISSIRTALALLLCKLRMGPTNKLLSILFQLPDAKIVSRSLESARSALMNTFVLLNLGLSHIVRQEIIDQHTSAVARQLACGGERDKAIFVVDGTYIYIQDDVVVVDRGFRDSINTMEGFGLNVTLPPFLNDRRQFATDEANESRCVTKIRWVVEAVNARLKQFKFFSNTVKNLSIPHLEEYLSIVCSIINRYRTPIKTSALEDIEIAEKMLSLKKATPTDLNGAVNYEIYRCNDYPNIICVPARSVHVNRLTHNPIIQFTPDEVLEWWRDCPIGNGLLGCYSHVASAIWFLSFQRWQLNSRNMPSGNFIKYVTDAPQISDFYDTTDDETDDRHP